MLSLLPDFADPLRLCSLGKVYEGTIALADLPRLAPLLTSSEGEAAFALAFAMDEERRPRIRVQVKATLIVECQRCLGPMGFEVDSVSDLVAVSGPDEADRLSLIEDELILAIPSAPMHVDDECAVDLETVNASPRGCEEPGDQGKPNPFAALAALKSDIDESD
jgi:uncharacterized protein